MTGGESRFAAPPLEGLDIPFIAAPERKRRVMGIAMKAMKQDKATNLDSEAMRLLRAIVLELDFDQVEGHAPSDTLAELRDKARRLIEAEKRQL
jgi:hypothetical protein